MGRTKKIEPLSAKQKLGVWLKAKKYYIVLLCCIMAVSLTYIFRLNAVQKKIPVMTSSIQVPVVAPTVQPKIDIPTPTPAKQATKSTPKPSVTETPEVKGVSTTMPTPTEPAKRKLSLPVSGVILNDYTADALVYSKTLGDWRVHYGVDIKAEIGSQVKAGDDGVVEDVSTDDQMGITIIIDHQNGIKSVYKNLSTSDMVRKDQSVKRGDIISGVGDTALVETGEVGHLHFEIFIDGQSVNPKDWLEM